MMLLSAGPAVQAEDNVMDIEEMGIKMEIPAEFSEFQGVFSPEANGISA